MTQESERTALNESDRLAGESAEAVSRPPVSADAVLQLARELLELNRSDEALAVIKQYTASTFGEMPAALCRAPF